MRVTRRTLLIGAALTLPATWVHAATLIIGPATGSWNLPAGYQYYHIDAAVGAGETHGMPMVVGGPTGSVTERSLFIAQESGGGMSFGSAMPAMTLWNHDNGSDPFDRAIVNDLRHMPDGTPLLIGASTSQRATTNGEEATIWQINTGHDGLVPVGLGFPVGLDGGVSILGGGNSVDGYAGSNGGDPIVVPPSGGGQTLDAGGTFLSGVASDLDKQTIVGSVEFRPAFWKKSQSGGWAFGNLQLPEWSDGTGGISDVADGSMGGHLYKPEIDNIVPVLWNTDGTLKKVFDLPGYSVTEMIIDQGSVVSLLNQGEFGAFIGPSRLFADGWDESRLVYGDILPALADGTAGTVRDISDGGGLWFLNRFEDANGVRYGVTDVISSVPEPNVSAFLLTVWVLVRRRYHRGHRI